jgi:ribose 5-phosphate isomerase B
MGKIKEKIMQKIHFGCDHAALELKNILIAHAQNLGYETADYGTYDDTSCDYPDIAEKTIIGGLPAVLVCGTGIGMSIAANKIHGVRAAVCHSEFDAEMTRRHNDSNVLCLGARTTGTEIAKRMLTLFLQTEFESGGNHSRRVDKIRVIENK